MSVGMDDFMRKPYRTREILDCLARNLKVRFVQDEGPQGTEAIPGSAGGCGGHAAAEVREALIAALVSLDSARVADLVRRISEDHPALGRALAASCRAVRIYHHPAGPEARPGAIDQGSPMNGASTILVVDDTHSSLKLLTDILRAAGYLVRPADSGELALASAAENPPDLILLDISMPEMDGFEVCRRLKSQERLRDIPVIFISALSETTDKVKAFAAGGVDFVTKPFQAAEVEARARTHLELRRQARLLQENYEALRRLEELRDNLVHMIVHDMRSPLMAMSGCFELLQKELAAAGAGPRRLVQRGLNAAAELTAMCDDLLDVSRLEAGQMPVHREPCDLLSLLSDAMVETKLPADSRGVAVRIAGQPVHASVDRGLIYRVIGNLLLNAIKHSPEKSVIKAGIRTVGGSVRVEVSDMGSGIPPEYHEKIFEKFCQLQARKEGHKHSTGLGLTFCKLAVQAHGGEIGVESRVGEGSTFWFTLPPAGSPS